MKTMYKDKRQREITWQKAKKIINDFECPYSLQIDKETIDKFKDLYYLHITENNDGKYWNTFLKRDG